MFGLLSLFFVGLCVAYFLHTGKTERDYEEMLRHFLDIIGWHNLPPFFMSDGEKALHSAVTGLGVILRKE